ncbi:FecR family protein [Niabella drilacis]|uniref:FecR family protein n=1 Tax=Niabella drilacis (strain DSM 25811 / CCM 8410 / CCUG 62505 / LMG 26954 / E90) TaxID=1285928 RepID=A0A1G6RME2_NIADE|nr:FecR domain-containing protein [Niabella drilacis]SDD05096.1 FecR family protein [Niabella drilacis]
MDKERIFELLGKRSARELTLQEQVELSRLLQEDPDARSFAAVLEEIMATSTSYEGAVADSEVDHFIKGVHNRISPRKEEARRIMLNWKAIAAVAAAVLIIAGSIAFFRDQAPVNTLPNVVATQKGNKTHMVLPDGTKVWVNADSRLTYEQSFGQQTREVVLTGEAYFDVVHDEKRPFIVHTQRIDVRVFGTAFNVRSYTDEPSTQTTLLRGSVQVSLKGVKDKKIMLAPNEKLVVQNGYPRPALKDKGAHLPQIELLTIKPTPKDSLVAETQWVNNKLVFDQERLEQIVPVLERWYNVKIILKNNAVSQTFSGVFENDTLEDVLQSLKLSAGIKYRIEKDLVTIY